MSEIASSKPKNGTPESAEWFRAALAELGESQAGFVRLLKRNGDDRQTTTILRSVQRMATGEARVSGEMRVLLTFLLRGQKRKEARKLLSDSAAPGIM